MGYLKKWIPPIVVRNDLASWKVQIQDIEDNMLTAGLTRVTTVASQLDLDTITIHPSTNEFVGFRLYAVNDSLQSQAPIYIRLDFGGIIQGLYNSASYGGGPFLAVRVNYASSFDADTGVLINPIGNFQYPQRYSHNGNVPGDRNMPGVSYICKNNELGFFGFIQGAGSRITVNNYYGVYQASTMAILLQRTTDENGDPTPNGFSVYGTDYVAWNNAGSIVDSNGWPNNMQAGLSQSYMYAGDAVSIRSNLMAPRLGGPITDLIDSVLEPQYIYSKVPYLKSIDNIISYRHDSLPPGSEFSMELYPDDVRTFVTLGRGSGLHPDERTGVAAHYTLAMLWQ